MARHAVARAMYKKVTAKEDHHKQTAAIEAKIRKQKEILRLQSMKIKSSQEQLQKSLAQKEQLTEDRAAALDRHATEGPQGKMPSTGGQGAAHTSAMSKA